MIKSDIYAVEKDRNRFINSLPRSLFFAFRETGRIQINNIFLDDSLSCLTTYIKLYNDVWKCIYLKSKRPESMIIYTNK